MSAKTKTKPKVDKVARQPPANDPAHERAMALTNKLADIFVGQTFDDINRCLSIMAAFTLQAQPGGLNKTLDLFDTMLSWHIYTNPTGPSEDGIFTR